MRRSSILTIFALFCRLLLIHQTPEALAQQEAPCFMSGSQYVYVALQEAGQPAPVGASGGACEIDPTTVPTTFEASLRPGTSSHTLTIAPTNNNIYPSCLGMGLSYSITPPTGDPIVLTGTGGLVMTLSKFNGSRGYNHLVSTGQLGYFTSASAYLKGDAIDGNVTYPASAPLLFDSPLDGCTSNGRNYVVMHNPIPNRGVLIPQGPSFYREPLNCSSVAQIRAIYIPVNSDWSLDFTCRNSETTYYYGPVLRDNNHAVPAYSTYGMLLFCLAIFGFGIWRMRRARFGDALAGR